MFLSLVPDTDPERHGLGSHSPLEEMSTTYNSSYWERKREGLGSPLGLLLPHVPSSLGRQQWQSPSLFIQRKNTFLLSAPKSKSICLTIRQIVRH